MQWDADLPADLVEGIWNAPHSLLAEGSTLQDKLRCTVARIDHPDGIFTWKRHNWGTLLRTLKKSLSQSPARKSWQDSHFLRTAGIPTPRTRAYLERTIGPFQSCSYLLTDYIVGTSLYRLLRFENPSQDFIQHLAQQVATIWQQLDELGTWHNDFKTENFLVDRAGKVWVIDFERMRRFRPQDRDRMRERQVKDVRDFLHPRNWRSDPAAAEVFRTAILATQAAKQTLAGPLGERHPLRETPLSHNRPQQLVTVLIPCRNSAEMIVGCLESVRDMADEILVADAGSTDDTVRLVREFGGCRIIERSATDVRAGSNGGVLSFKNWAQQQATHDWILHLRPDERLNGELSRQVQDVLASEPIEDGFRVERTVYLRGKRLRHGSFQNGPSIRLYRKSAGRFELLDGRAEVCVPSGNVGHVKSRLVYEACPTIESCIHGMLRMAGRAAVADMQNGRRTSGRSLLWRVPWEFVRSYVIRRGCFDGWTGWHASFLSALSVYLRDAQHCELEQPVVLPASLARDNWKQLKVFAPETFETAAAVTDSASKQAAA